MKDRRMTFAAAVDELRVLLSRPEVPAEVVDSALRLIKSPLESLRVVPDGDLAFGTAQTSVSLQPSDRLLQFLAAARAGKWENIVV